MLPGFGVIIPMYNEEAGANTCVLQVLQQFRQMPNRTALIAVNDGSKDATGSILDQLSDDFKTLTVVHHQSNMGYGAALRTGVQQAAAAAFDYCVFMDSDLTNDPADLPRFAAEMARGIDVIKASRFCKGGRMEGVPWRRSVFSVAGNVAAGFLFGIGVSDCTNGFRAVKTSILTRMELKERGFPIIVEELYHCKFLAHTYSEVPVVLTSRSANQRSTSFAYNYETLSAYWSYGWKAFRGQYPPQSNRTRELNAGNM